MPASSLILAKSTPAAVWISSSGGICVAAHKSVTCHSPVPGAAAPVASLGGAGNATAETALVCGLVPKTAILMTCLGSL